MRASTRCESSCDRCMDERPTPSSSMATRPVPWNEKVGIQARLRRARFRLPIVAPGRLRRHRHEDRLGATVALQPEQRAAIPHQVELDVTAPTIRLERALALAVLDILAAPEDRRIGIEERIADGQRQRLAALEAAVGEIVEEDAADASRLATMAQVEVAVAGRLE